MEKTKITCFLSLCLSLLLWPVLPAGADMPKKIDSGTYILYLPSGLDISKKYPLVVMLSPSADAESVLRPWIKAAQEYKWIILASRQHRNGMEFKQIGNIISNTIRTVTASYPVDRKKVIAAGFSGGGMSSHYLAMAYPQMISAVIINTGMISENYSGGENYSYPGNKLAVFLASPSDFRYQEMKRDSRFLKGLGWDTKWIEFEGGHSIAPQETYLEAAKWLDNKLNETK